MRFLTRNLIWKLFALVAAFCVWLNVASEPELATIVSVPVEYNNFPKDLEISSDIVDKIEVEARGPAGQLRSLNDSHIAAIVDFANVKSPGERTFTLTTAQLKLPRGIELVLTIPAQLRFQLEKRITRAVPVKVAFSGKAQAGFTVANVDIEPPDLTITGPESHVLKAKPLEADPFDLTGVDADTVRKLSVYVEEPDVRILNTPQVTVKIRVRQGR
jgi:YbbR domain-containing protein